MSNLIQFPSKPDFGEVYEQYYDRIYKYTYTILLDREMAEDVVSETFLLALKHYDSYDPGKASIATWLSRIAHNQAINLVRSASYKKRAEMPEYYEPADTGETSRAAEDRHLITELYSRLTEEEREFLNMRFVMDLKDSEIAGMIGISAKAVNKRYQRLLAKCRDLIGDAY